MDKLRKTAFLGLLAILVCTGSCTKNESSDLAPVLNVADDIIITQRPVIHTFRMLARAVNDPELQQSHQAYFDGASVTFDSALNRYSFFFMGMYSPDSVLRHGMIEAYISGDLAIAGTTVRFTFNNYREDGMSVNGDDTLTSAGTEGTDLMFFNSFSNGVIIKDTVGTIRYSASLEYRLPANPPGGYPESLITVNGRISGTSSKGLVFSSEISSPCVYPVYSSLCAWIRQGSILFSLTDSPGEAGTIGFPPLASCNDSVYYDFGTTTYRWRMKSTYLSH
jgi:hypothetical protein